MLRYFHVADKFDLACGSLIKNLIRLIQHKSFYYVADKLYSVSSM